MMTRLPFLLSFLIPAGLFFAIPLPLQATEIPFLGGRVNDTAGILSPEMIKQVEALLKDHEDSTSNQVVVLTILSLEGEALEAYSIRVVDTWKLGQKGKDNGVLLLIVRNDRKVRIEVGRGLEGDLPDITCGLIIRKEIVPRFKQADYDGGVRAGVHAILAAIRGSYTAETSDEGLGDFWVRVWASSIFIVVVGVFTTITIFSRGFQSWFLYCFLIPFWLAFPLFILGTVAGLTLFTLYAVSVPVLKAWFSKSTKGKLLYKRW